MDERKQVVICFRLAIVVFVLFFIIRLSDCQQDSSANIISISNIPTCVNVFGDGTDQTQRLCGTTGADQNVADVRLNIQVGQNVVQSDNTLIFTAFPPEGQTTSNLPSQSNPCGNTPIGSNCTVFPSTITITWKTHSVVAGYSLSPIVDGIPLAYILYKAPFYGAEDDEDMNWYPQGGLKNCKGQSTAADKGKCYFGCDTENSELQVTPCMFQGAGAFIRNVDASNTCCTDSSLCANEPPCNTASTDLNSCNCGSNQVEIFGTCGGFLEECGGSTDNLLIDNVQIPICSCFPYNVPSSDITSNQRCLRELQIAGVHTTNGHNYLDEGCSSTKDGSGLLTDYYYIKQFFAGGFPVDGYIGGVSNFPNIASAACRHMSYIVALTQNNNNNQQTLANVQPFVQLDPTSICSSYSYLGNYGCGPPYDYTVSQDCRDGVSCWFCPNDTPRYSTLDNAPKCTNSGLGFDSSDNSPCHQDYKCDNQNTNGCFPCNYFDRFGPAWPLTGQTEIGSGGNTIDPIDNGVCIVCRADYQNSAYLPGLWGLQRKLKRLIEDWRDSWIGAYNVPDFTNADNARSGSLPSQQTVGFNYYIIENSAGEKNIFILQPVWSQELLRTCSPLQSGDTCWSSFNQPPDFFATGSSNSGDPSIVTQGYEQVTPVSGEYSSQYFTRGLAITPYWVSPACADGDFCGGHIYRCGHYCDPAFVNGYTSTNNPTRKTKDPKGLAVAKGFTGLAPLSSAFAVSRQAKIITGVDFTISYIDSNGNNVSQILTLTTDNLGGGNSVSYLDAGGTGVVGRINNINTPNGETAPILGGVLVVTGTNGITGVGTGSIWGQLNADPSSISENPWQKLTYLIKLVESKYPGITGYKQNGCPVPIATFITALQCFSVSTACAAPWDLCQAISQTCSQNTWCDDHNVKPVVVYVSDTSSRTSQYNVFPNGYDGDLTTIGDSGGTTCDIQTSDYVKGVAWYWMQPSTIAAFGPNCGQYGMNPWTFGKDAETQNYICQSSSDSEKLGVPCVPGISENVDIPSPCQILGNFANFHGQTSTEAVSIIAGNIGSVTPNNRNNACFTQAQQNLFSSSATAPTSGCNSNFANLASIPTLGLPPTWNYVDPATWVNNNYMLTNNLDTTVSLDISLFISGYGLNAELTTVDNARFVNQDNLCVIFQNSIAGEANLTVQNIGSSSSEYIVNFINCTDPTGQFTGPLGSSNTNPIASIDPGQIGAFKVDMSFNALGSLNALRCYFSVSPAAYSESVVLDEMAINCNVAGFLQQANFGEVGNDGLLLNPNKASGDACSINPGFGCWLIGGSLLAHITFDIFLGCLFISTVFFLYVIVKVIIDQNRYEQLTTHTRKQEQKLNEIQSVVNKQKQAETLKFQEKLRQESFEKNVPRIANVLGSVIKESIN